MTHWTDATDLLDERADAAPGVVARYAPGAFAFVMSAALGVYLVYLRPMLHAPAPEAPATAALKAPADPFGSLAPVIPPPVALALAKPAANPFGALVTQGFGETERFALTEESAPVPPVPPSDLRAPGDSVPLPPRRPSLLARNEQPDDAPAPPTGARPQPVPSSLARLSPPPAAGPSLIEKLFGGGSTSAAKTPSTTMAYAEPPPTSSASSALAARGGIGSGSGGGGGFGGFLRGLTSSVSPTSRFGDHVAVYDISARMVYLPDGTQLEAHSGLGVARDDPSTVGVRMRGVTPAATYALTPREELFHGVAALRLTPIDSNIFGRAGLLAHTYMLGPDGDSNGCVSFRDYDAFLRAYRSGQISKLVVVTRL